MSGACCRRMWKHSATWLRKSLRTQSITQGQHKDKRNEGGLRLTCRAWSCCLPWHQPGKVNIHGERAPVPHPTRQMESDEREEVEADHFLAELHRRRQRLRVATKDVAEVDVEQMSCKSAGGV